MTELTPKSLLSTLDAARAYEKFGVETIKMKQVKTLSTQSLDVRNISSCQITKTIGSLKTTMPKEMAEKMADFLLVEPNSLTE